MDKLIDRLRGFYDIGPDGKFHKRLPNKLVPLFALEAADRIEELEEKVSELEMIINE